MASGTGAVEAAGASHSRKPRKAPLRRAAVLSGMWERIQPHDPLLERQPPCGIRLPGLPPERKSHCSSHRIHEEVLDKAVWNYAEELRKRYAAGLKKVAQLQKQWALRRPSLDAHCLALQKEIQKREQEIDELVMEKLKNGECSTRQPDSI